MFTQGRTQVANVHIDERVRQILTWTRRRLVWLLLGTYVLGALVPEPGLRARAGDLAAVSLAGGSVSVSVPVAMLGLLLIVAGLSTNVEEFKRLFHTPAVLASGVAVNAVYPILFAVAASVLLARWPETDETQSILAGLAIIGAMPIAGSSTAWSQNARGNVALSLALVWLSTAMSPLLTPVALESVALVTKGDYSQDLHRLAHQGASAFVLIAVVVPSVLGLATRLALGRQRTARLLPTLHFVSLIDLLGLNYLNASAALPSAVRQPDWDLWAITLAITATMCVGAFAAGWWIPRLLRAQRDDQVSLMFGIGMNNNGSGLVLAAATMAHHQLVLLPLICYNLVQQLVAGLVDAARRRADRQPS